MMDDHQGEGDFGVVDLTAAIYELVLSEASGNRHLDPDELEAWHRQRAREARKRQRALQVEASAMKKQNDWLKSRGRAHKFSKQSPSNGERYEVDLEKCLNRRSGYVAKTMPDAHFDKAVESIRTLEDLDELGEHFENLMMASTWDALAKLLDLESYEGEVDHFGKGVWLYCVNYAGRERAEWKGRIAKVHEDHAEWIASHNMSV